MSAALDERAQGALEERKRGFLEERPRGGFMSALLTQGLKSGGRAALRNTSSEARPVGAGFGRVGFFNCHASQGLLTALQTDSMGRTEP